MAELDKKQMAKDAKAITDMMGEFRKKYDVPYMSLAILRDGYTQFTCSEYAHNGNDDSMKHTYEFISIYGLPQYEAMKFKDINKYCIKHIDIMWEDNNE